MQNCGSVLLWMERCKTMVQSCCGWNDVKLWFSLAVDGTTQGYGSVLLWMERCKTMVQSCCGWNDAKLWYSLAVDGTTQNYGSVLLGMERCKTMVQSFKMRKYSKRTYQTDGPNSLALEFKRSHCVHNYLPMSQLLHSP